MPEASSIAVHPAPYVLLDVAATPAGRRARLDVVRSVRAALSIPLTVGGGVADVEDAARLLDAGADKVSVNSAALRDPSLVDCLARRFGSQCTVLAIDAASVPGGGWQALAHSGVEASGRDAVEWAREVGRRGAGEILLTSWDRDGTGDGYDLDLTPIGGGGYGASDFEFIVQLNAVASRMHMTDVTLIGYGRRTTDGEPFLPDADTRSLDRMEWVSRFAQARDRKRKSGDMRSVRPIRTRYERVL